jgi:hypothetical protein
MNSAPKDGFFPLQASRQDHFRLKRNHVAGLQNSDDDPHWQPR